MATNKPNRPKTPENCPVCGEDVPRGALACPECGADHNSGWRTAGDIYDGLDLPGNDFNYDDFIQKEFGSPLKPARIKMIWWITAVVILIVSVALYFLAAR